MKRVYLFVLTLTLLFASILGFTIWKLPPIGNNGNIIWKNFSLFFIGLSFTINGLVGFIIYFIKRLFIKTEDNRLIFRQSLRQAFFFALIIDVLLIFQKVEVLTAINIILLILIFIILEIYILSMGKRNETSVDESIKANPKK